MKFVLLQIFIAAIIALNAPHSSYFYCGNQAQTFTSFYDYAKFIFPRLVTEHSCIYTLTVPTKFYQGISLNARMESNSSLSFYFKVDASPASQTIILTPNTTSNQTAHLYSEGSEYLTDKDTEQFTLVLIPMVGVGGVMEVTVTGIKRSETKDQNYIIIVLIPICVFLLCAFCCILIIPKLKCRKNKQNTVKINADILRFQNIIQNQHENEDDAQSVSFEQAMRYNNYLIMKDSKQALNINDVNVLDINRQDNMKAEDQIHTGSFISLQSNKNSSKALKDFQTLVELGLIDVDEIREQRFGGA
ncbi:unnamed protein product [Moneuplotes crassus]|uniref:CUB-like domain-containing protein n=1 Tax=Euplotes crassus TaxID=5936 RepID=A0AAD1X9N8_EUPCR|nr:unnamed protein product [Moneuplotes crassus]